MHDISALIDDHRQHQNPLSPHETRSKLKLLVPTIGLFFTPLPLPAAFAHQDALRHISSRRFVPPSFNDIRLVLNTAQILALLTPQTPTIGLLTFDGDVTLYPDGGSLSPASPLIPLFIAILKADTPIAIVTAAGYQEAERYHERLHGLLEAVTASTELSPQQKSRLVVLGGESSYLFRYSASAQARLAPVPRTEWVLPSMHTWDDPSSLPVRLLLDTAASALEACIKTMALPAVVIRKERAVGLVPDPLTRVLLREQLEETVLTVQSELERHAAITASGIPFCAFNGGSDVWVDLGDKAWGVRAMRAYFGSEEGGDKEDEVPAARCLHVGDQFLSASGSNDFKARLTGTTAWIASPEETVALLGEVTAKMEEVKRGVRRPGLGSMIGLGG